MEVFHYSEVYVHDFLPVRTEISYYAIHNRYVRFKRRYNSELDTWHPSITYHVTSYDTSQFASPAHFLETERKEEKESDLKSISPVVQLSPDKVPAVILLMLLGK
ncbi:hypothetical protein [Spirosoma aerolatum]|uniref:hypothetical protein n=1 Tax=Spirosoma aerolatum TaxID=1211326 RepID=UPI0009AD987C|nr:hypothetical protein [Spirosoma aerolatum]